MRCVWLLRDNFRETRLIVGPVVHMYCSDMEDIYLDSTYHCRYQGLSGDIWKNNFKIQGEDSSQQDLTARMIDSKRLYYVEYESYTEG